MINIAGKGVTPDGYTTIWHFNTSSGFSGLTIEGNYIVSGSSISVKAKEWAIGTDAKYEWSTYMYLIRIDNKSNWNYSTNSYDRNQTPSRRNIMYDISQIRSKKLVGVTEKPLPQKEPGSYNLTGSVTIPTPGTYYLAMACGQSNHNDGSGCIVGYTKYTIVSDPITIKPSPPGVPILTNLSPLEDGDWVAVSGNQGRFTVKIPPKSTDYYIRYKLYIHMYNTLGFDFDNKYGVRIIEESGIYSNSYMTYQVGMRPNDEDHEFPNGISRTDIYVIAWNEQNDVKSATTRSKLYTMNARLAPPTELIYDKGTTIQSPLLYGNSYRVTNYTNSSHNPNLNINIHNTYYKGPDSDNTIPKYDNEYYLQINLEYTERTNYHPHYSGDEYVSTPDNTPRKILWDSPASSNTTPKVRVKLNTPKIGKVIRNPITINESTSVQYSLDTAKPSSPLPSPVYEWSVNNKVKSTQSSCTIDDDNYKVRVKVQWKSGTHSLLDSDYSSYSNPIKVYRCPRRMESNGFTYGFYVDKGSGKINLEEIYQSPNKIIPVNSKLYVDWSSFLPNKDLGRFNYYIITLKSTDSDTESSISGINDPESNNEVEAFDLLSLVQSGVIIPGEHYKLILKCCYQDSHNFIIWDGTQEADVSDTNIFTSPATGDGFLVGGAPEVEVLYPSGLDSITVNTESPIIFKTYTQEYLQGISKPKTVKVTIKDSVFNNTVLQSISSKVVVGTIMYNSDNSQYFSSDSSSNFKISKYDGGYPTNVGSSVTKGSIITMNLPELQDDIHKVVRDITIEVTDNQGVQSTPYITKITYTPPSYNVIKGGKIVEHSSSTTIVDVVELGNLVIEYIKAYSNLIDINNSSEMQEILEYNKYSIGDFRDHIISNNSTVGEITFGNRNLALGTNKKFSNWVWSTGKGVNNGQESHIDGATGSKVSQDFDSPLTYTLIQYRDRRPEIYEPSTEYTISFEVYPHPSSRTALGFNIQLITPSSTDPLTPLSKYITFIPDIWNKISVTLTTKPSLPPISNQRFTLCNMNSNKGSFYVFRNLKIEKGNKSTPWTPAPEDVNEYKTLLSWFRITRQIYNKVWQLTRATPILHNRVSTSSGLTVQLQESLYNYKIGCIPGERKFIYHNSRWTLATEVINSLGDLGIKLSGAPIEGSIIKIVTYSSSSSSSFNNNHYINPGLVTDNLRGNIINARSVDESDYYKGNLYNNILDRLRFML